MVFLSVKLKGINGGYLEHYRYRGVDEVILVSVNFEDPDVKRLIESEIPVVLIDKESEYGTSIMSQNYEGTKAAVQYLAKCGHQKTGFVDGGVYTTMVTNDRIRGFKDGMEEAGLNVVTGWMKKGGYYKPQHTCHVVKKLLGQKDIPTALLLPDDYAAMFCYQVARELQFRIPDDISFIGNDGLEIGEQIMPQLTTIKQDAKEIGRQAR